MVEGKDYDPRDKDYDPRVRSHAHVEKRPTSPNSRYMPATR